MLARLRGNNASKKVTWYVLEGILAKIHMNTCAVLALHGSVGPCKLKPYAAILFINQNIRIVP